MTKAITQEQALKIYEDDLDDRTPYRVLNEAGEAAVAEWVTRHAKHPERLDLSAWFREAEQAAGDDENPFGGFNVLMEMRGISTSSGHPEVMRIDASWYEWRV